MWYQRCKAWSRGCFWRNCAWPVALEDVQQMPSRHSAQGNQHVFPCIHWHLPAGCKDINPLSSLQLLRRFLITGVAALQRGWTVVPCSSLQMCRASRECSLSRSLTQKLASAQKDGISPAFHSSVAWMGPWLICLLWVYPQPNVQGTKKMLSWHCCFSNCHH